MQAGLTFCLCSGVTWAHICEPMAHQVLFHMSPWIADLTCFHDRGSVAEHGSLRR